MVQLLKFFGACCALVALVHCQNIRQTDKALQDMIEYASLFEHRSLEPQDDSVTVPKDNKPQDDPELRELFKEFLLQRRKNSEGQKTTQIPSTTTTTTTTTQASVTILPVLNIEQEPVSVQPAQKRRLTLRRKIIHPTTLRNNLATDPTSSSHITEPTTRIIGRPLRQKQTTTNSPIVFEEPIEELVEIDQEHPEIVPRIFDNIAFKPAPPVNSEQARFDEIESRKQAENAKYQFATAVDDGISGNLLHREEVRDGLVVRGKYSFSDGYFMRTVHYEADERGYRIVKEEVLALDGPHANPNGHAKVSSYADGNAVNYEITKDDIRKKDEKLTFSTVFDRKDKN